MSRLQDTSTRGAILDAARSLFAARGYDRTTIRAIAAACGVDPALVYHYFDGKDDLLREALTPPVDVSHMLPAVLTGSRGALGERVTRWFLSIWEDDRLRPTYLAIVRCAASHDEAADIMRRVLADRVLTPVVDALGLGDAPLRADLAASQLIGLAMVRYLTRLEPLASAGTEEVVAAVAPTIQRYLAGPLLPPDHNADPHETVRCGPGSVQ